MLSILDLFRVGLGPSSSHTVGPMRIANRFLDELQSSDLLSIISKFQVTLRGSLAFTGPGHATPEAVIYGLCGLRPETTLPEMAEAALQEVSTSKSLLLPNGRRLPFDPDTDIIFDYENRSGLHPNEMQITALDTNGTILSDSVFYSTGGGFIASEKQLLTPVENDIVPAGRSSAYEYTSAIELLDICSRENKRVSDVVFGNETSIAEPDAVNEQLDIICNTMNACIDRGLNTTGQLPGKLKVKRRAAAIWSRINTGASSNEREEIFDLLSVYALAVNEENAAGGQVVTAPTNGAAGIIPSVMRQYTEPTEVDKRRRFLLAAGGIGLLYKQRASISGAEMGCQGEVGVASSMAAAGLAEIWGASPDQVTIAAEIAMEHHLGMTCDPVGGLVQIPCIERNAMGSVKAVNAARLALHAIGPTHVSLDTVIETMRQTGLDMSEKYKETSQGGLAANVVEC
ncbi:MAG: L-serine ammonia-lyase [Ponticaulis sp.]|nr:L-serine ammonia-lyase [Ponticaulis sp.]